MSLYDTHGVSTIVVLPFDLTGGWYSMRHSALARHAFAVFPTTGKHVGDAVVYKAGIG